MNTLGGKMIIVITARDPLTGRVVVQHEIDYTGSNAARQGSPSEKVQDMKKLSPEVKWEWEVKKC